MVRIGGSLPLRKRHNGWANLLYQRLTPKRIALALLQLSLLWMVIGICLWLHRHTQCYLRENGVVWKEAPIHSIPRACPDPNYPRLVSEKAPKICLTTLTDRSQPSWWQRMVRCRDFSSVQTLTFPNHAAYAAKHNYQIVDASDWIDSSRPPAWSKIKAVKRLFTDPAYDCDWVVWLDSDTLVMNSNIKLESLIPADESANLVITEDHSFMFSSGVWMMRKSEWSVKFLEEWWNSKGYVRSAGLSLSGDNAAFGHLVQQRVNSDQKSGTQHILVPPRCNLNSFAVFLTDTQLLALQDPEKLKLAPWYMSDKFYHQGDFIVHAAGVDQKAAVIELLLQRAL
jgi:hypothetical protein